MNHENKPAAQASFLSVKSVKRNQGKAEITLSSGELILMPRCMLHERPYKAGVPFDAASHKEWIQHRAYAFALDKAISLLSVRSRTEHELAKAIRDCAFDESVIARVMARLQQAGYIDDADFAEHWVSSRTSKGLGTQRIRMELRQKGVGQPQIDQALSGIDHDSILQGAIKAAEKAARGRNLAEHSDRQKILAALARRGFDFSTAKQALQHVLSHQ